MNHLPKNDPRAKVKAIERALTDDLRDISDAELEKEFAEDKLDMSEIANSMRCSVLDIILRERKKKLLQARAEMQAQAQVRKDGQIRPNIDTIKRRLGDLFAAKPALAVAFRQGKSQSENDWISLWDDLVEIGEVSGEDDES